MPPLEFFRPSSSLVQLGGSVDFVMQQQDYGNSGTRRQKDKVFQLFKSFNGKLEFYGTKLELNESE